MGIRFLYNSLQMGEVLGFNPQSLAEEARKILESRDLVYDLAGRRLALTATQLQDHLSRPENTFHLAIVGSPNRSKTTYAYSCYKVLKAYDIPASYHDLDLYTQSGKAISGEIDWSYRIKRGFDEVPEEEVVQSIRAFLEDRPGVAIADFPGKLNDPYQTDRLKGVDLAIILGRDRGDVGGWERLCSNVGVKRRFLISETKPPLPYVTLYPSFFNLTRTVRVSPMMLVSVTSILQEIAQIRGVKISPWESYFSKAERVVLGEILDFSFSIRMDE